jgi:hypothetical protein
VPSVHRLASLLALCVAAAPLRLQAAPAADASDPAILVWPPELSGIAGEQAAASIRAALRAGLTRADLSPIDAGSAAADCSDPACRGAAAQAGGADYLVTLQVRAIDRDFEVRVQLVDAATGESRELVEGCSICGLEDACALVESLGARLGPMRRAAVEEAAARRLQEQALQQQPRLRVRSSPPGADIYVDGQKIGVTPLEQPLAVGRHTVELRRADYLVETREVNLSRGLVSDLSIPLRADGKLPPSARSRALLISGSTLIGLGVGGLAVMGAGLGRGAAAERDGAARASELTEDGRHRPRAHRCPRGPASPRPAGQHHGARRRGGRRRPPDRRRQPRGRQHQQPGPPPRRGPVGPPPRRRPLAHRPLLRPRYSNFPSGSGPGSHAPSCSTAAPAQAAEHAFPKVWPSMPHTGW